MAIKFRGAIYSIKVDREAESKVTLEIPLSDLNAALSLAQMTQTELLFSVKEADQSESQQTTDG